MWIEDIGPTQVVSVGKRADRGKKVSMVEQLLVDCHLYQKACFGVAPGKGHPRISVSANVSCNAKIDIM